MTVTAHNTRPDEGARLDMPDSVYIVSAIPSGPLHRSPWASTIYLLEGNVVIRFEDGQVSLNPGSSITILARPHARSTYSASPRGFSV